MITSSSSSSESEDVKTVYNLASRTKTTGKGKEELKKQQEIIVKKEELLSKKDLPERLSKKELPKVNVREKLTVSPFNWEFEDKIGSNESLQIRIWAHDEEDNPNLIRVEDYKPFIYFALPYTHEGEDDYMWDANDAKEIHKSLAKAMGDNSCYLEPFKTKNFCKHITLYFYSKDKTPFIIFRFSNLDALRHASNILKKGLYFNYNRLRSDAQDVMLFEIDAIRKMLTDVKSKYCSWLTCQARKVTEDKKISTIEREYIVSWTTIAPYESNRVPRPTWCAFDIECYSHNHKGFPCEWRASDVINIITAVFYKDGVDFKTGDKYNWEVYAIVLGDCIMEDEEVQKYTKIITVNTEKEVIDTFARLVRKHNPDLLTGYNILPFDNKYINARLKRLKLDWPRMGRLKRDAKRCGYIGWESSAYKAKNMYIPDMPGRVSLDFCEHTMRSFTWGTYNLANAAKQILQDPKLVKQDMPAEEQFQIYKNARDYIAGKHKDKQALVEMGRFVKYCIYDSRLVAHMANKVNWWIGVREMCNAVGVHPQHLLTKGQQARVLSLLYDQCMNMTTPSFDKKGNPILDENGIQKEVPMKIIMDMRPDPPNFYYEGGAVQEPQKGCHRLVFVLDFKSLYPSLIIAYNLCFTTLIHPTDHDDIPEGSYTKAPVMISDIDDTPVDDIDDLVDEIMNKKEKKKTKAEIVYREADFRFVTSSLRKGVLPTILRGLLGARSAVRKLVPTNDTEAVVYDQRQLALKVCANSVYGFTGVRKGGKRPCLEITATTTYYGRLSIHKTIDFIKEHYKGELVYGDTDSCMMTVPGVPGNEMHKMAREIASKASDLFTKPLELEMEGIYDLFCVKRKLYTKFTYTDPNSKWTPGLFELEKSKIYPGLPDITVKGLTPARRDTCKFVKNSLLALLYMIMLGEGYYSCVHYIAKRAEDLYNGKIGLDDLTITKGLGANYANEGASMKVFSEEMAKRGKPMQPGERHEFVIVDILGEKKVGKKMMLRSIQETIDEEYRDPIDCKHYFKDLQKKVDIMISTAYNHQKSTLDKVELKYRGRVITAYTPAKCMSIMYNANYYSPKDVTDTLVGDVIYKKTRNLPHVRQHTKYTLKDVLRVFA